ncbi:MAG: dynamin family protein [Gammaproteobacteria bacterium]|nr:dynamin family protein [Gammaproteobacteria bacterium]
MWPFSLRTTKRLRSMLSKLEQHIMMENSVLSEALDSYKQLDQLAYRMGLLSRDESFALRIAWWPMISVLGTFSSGKSTFINTYLGQDLQSTGNQAVDDKFTVVCFGGEGEPRVLPGMALNGDARFPFYQISREIEKVAEGEGRRIDSFLQLKTSNAEHIKRKIIIDSPGFDADAQRNSILRISSHIIDLSDLVLLFFDARHPEPGAMQDTLNHLVEATIGRQDANKFLYILNQIDTAAREDNPEDVVGAWQRALAQKGLTAGRFYTIYNEKAAVQIDDETRKARFQKKRDADMADITARMAEVEVERSYRIVGGIEKLAKYIEESIVPELNSYISRWRTRVLWGDAVFASAIALIIGGGLSSFGMGINELSDWLASNKILAVVAGVSVYSIYLLLHFWWRSRVASKIENRIPEQKGPGDPNLRLSFRSSVRFSRSVFQTSPDGWGKRTIRKLEDIIQSANQQTELLNDRYTDPSGKRSELDSMNNEKTKVSKA